VTTIKIDIKKAIKKEAKRKRTSNITITILARATAFVCFNN
jgi:hypothetical protein